MSREWVCMKGRWWDEITTNGKKIVTPVGNNLVVTTGKSLLAALLKNDPVLTSGIQYHCIGQGDTAWDTGGIPASTTGLTALLNEIDPGGRKAPDEIVYLDDADSGNPVAGPTGRIRIKTTWSDTELTGGVYIREQTLFGGNATVTKDSGYMINIIYHNRIWKDGTVTLTRYIEFEF